MGGLLLPEKLPQIPTVIIESPVNGVTSRQFRIINLLAAIKGAGWFPLDNESVQGMLRSGTFMKARNKSPTWARNAFQINGALGCSPLSRWDGNTFGKIPNIDKYLEFPKIDHVGLLTDPEVIFEVIYYLDDFYERK